MATLLEMQLQLDALRQLRAGGVKRVKTKAGGGEKEAEFKTDKEMASAISDLERRITAALGPQASTIRIYSSKGV